MIRLVDAQTNRFAVHTNRFAVRDFSSCLVIYLQQYLMDVHGWTAWNKKSDFELLFGYRIKHNCKKKGLVQSRPTLETRTGPKAGSGGLGLSESQSFRLVGIGFTRKLAH